MNLIFVIVFIVLLADNLQRCFCNWHIFRQTDEIIRTLQVEGPQDAYSPGKSGKRLCQDEIHAREMKCMVAIQFLSRKNDLEVFDQRANTFEPLTCEKSEADVLENHCIPLRVEGLRADDLKEIFRCTDVKFIRNVKNRSSEGTSSSPSKIERIEYTNGIFMSDSSKPNNYYLYTKRNDSDIMEPLFLLVGY